MKCNFKSGFEELLEDIIGALDLEFKTPQDKYEKKIKISKLIHDYMEHWGIETLD